MVPLRMDTTIVDIVILRKWKSVIIGGMLIGLMKGLANCLLYWNGGFCWILSLKNSFLMSRKLLLYCLFYLWFYGYYESDISKMAFDKLCNCKRFLSPSLRNWIFKVLNWMIQWFKIQRVAVDLEIFWPNMP